MEEKQKKEVSEAQTTRASPDASPLPGGPQAPQQPTPAASAPAEQQGPVAPVQGSTGQAQGQMPTGQQEGMTQPTETSGQQKKPEKEQSGAV